MTIQGTAKAQTTVRADADSLWALVARGDGVHRWFTSVITDCRLEGEGEGARRYCTMVDGAALEERIIRVDPAKRMFVYGIDKHPLPATNVEATITITSKDSGADITWSASFDATDAEAVSAVSTVLEGLYAQGIASLDAAVRGDSMLNRIDAGLKASGYKPDDAEALALVSEFHVGGRLATLDLLKLLDPKSSERILDIGAGLGGPTRTLVSQYAGVEVTGIDLDPAMVRVGEALKGRLGITDGVHLSQGNAAALSFDDKTFDAALTMHVHMFVDAPKQLFVEAARVLKPGGRLAVFDPVLIDTNDMVYPVAWAPSADRDKSLEPSELLNVLQHAGLEINQDIDMSATSIARLEAGFAAAADQGTAPPPGLNLIVGPQFGRIVKNVHANLAAGRIGMRLLLATKPLAGASR